LLNFRKKGFSLIEVLVVITIIGILASIVLTNLGVARNKAKNTRIMADLSQIRNMAASIESESDPPAYSSLCSGNDLNTTPGSHNYIAQVFLIREDIRTQLKGSGVLTPGTDISCQTNTDGTSYCVNIALLGGGFYCIDSTGYAGTSKPSCSAVNFDCE